MLFSSQKVLNGEENWFEYVDAINNLGDLRNLCCAYFANINLF